MVKNDGAHKNNNTNIGFVLQIVTFTFPPLSMTFIYSFQTGFHSPRENEKSDETKMFICCLSPCASSSYPAFTGILTLRSR